MRTVLVLAAFAILLPALWPVATHLPPFGFPTSGYGATVDLIGPPLRHIANMVTLVNFDVRGIDTLGEEMMLVAAVTGTVLLLRGSRGEDEGDEAERRDGRPVMPRSDAIVAAGRIVGTMLLIFGLYTVVEGTQTPGGGFQAGVIIATSFLLIYLGTGYAEWRIIVRGPVMAAIEASGGLAFVLLAAIPLMLGAAALQNILPLGTFKSMTGGGTMIIANVATALAVAGGFGGLLLEFLEETRAPKHDDEDDALDDDTAAEGNT